MKLKPRQWQKYWHECFDKDPPRENDDIWSEPLPDIGEDYRLLCGFAWVTPETRKKVLSVMPQGDEIFVNLEHYMQVHRRSMDVETAKRKLSNGIELLHQYVQTDLQKENEFRILTEQKISLYDAFKIADMVTIDLDDRLSDRVQEYYGEDAVEAFCFLKELIYWQGNNYEGARFSLWPLCSRKGQENPYRPFMELLKGGWSAGWDGSGVFLYDRRKEFGLG